MKSMTHYSESLHQMLPFMSKMQQNRWRLGLRPRWGAYMPLIKFTTHYSESLHQMLPFMSKMHQNRWRLGLRPRPRWGNLPIYEIHDTLLRIIAPDASIHVQNAPKSLAAGAPPQTPLGELAALPRSPSCYGLGWRFGDNSCGGRFDVCPLACDRCPLAVLRLATGLFSGSCITASLPLYVIITKESDSQ